MALFKRLKSFFIPGSKPRYSGSRQPAPERSDNRFTEQTSDWPDTVLYHDLEQTYYQYFIGVNTLMELELNPFEQDVLQRLENIFEENPQTLAEQIPRLPDITPKLLHLLRTNDFSWKEIASLISRDPVLLLEVLKLANSSRFNLQASEDRLEHVLVQLGLLEVRKVIMKTALKPIMLFEGGHFLKHCGTKIWEHSVKTGSVCQLIALQQKQDAFDAYLSGLLHNLGMTIVVQKMNSIEKLTDAPRSLLFKKQLLGLSKRLSVLIAQSWELQPPVIQAISDQTDELNNNKSILGQILLQASAVSMQHTLESVSRWSINSNSESTEQIVYNQLKPELDALSI